MPRKTTLCEHIFQQEGVFGDIVIGEFPVDFIPFDSDVLSLELPTAFRVRQLTRSAMPFAVSKSQKRSLLH